jgi:hypothetical protein
MFLKSISIYLIDFEFNIVKRSSLGRIVFSTQEGKGAVKLNVESIENITGMAFREDKDRWCGF